MVWWFKNMITNYLTVLKWKILTLYPLLLNLGSWKVILCGFQDWAINGHAAFTLLHGASVNGALNFSESLLTQGCQTEETQVLQKRSVWAPLVNCPS